jgi:pyruvate formate lyase activating enzyme
MPEQHTAARSTLLATIFDIQRFTVHDGPGIRTALFFKGCPLRCLWCSNPEGIASEPQVGVFSKDCIGTEACGWCLRVCTARRPDGAPVIQVEDGKVAGIDRAYCTSCMECAEICPNDSLRAFGQKWTVEGLMDVILADRSYYQKSGGGVTLGGGDPLRQWRFVRELLRECKRYGIHTCVESELHCSQGAVDAILPYVDLVLTDIKHLDPLLHRRYTGRGNALILNNIKHIVAQGVDVVLRIPVIPGHNDSEEHVAAVGRWVETELGNRIKQLQLLPYRILGKEKYAALGVAYPMDGQRQPQREEYEPNLRHIAAVLSTYGVPAVPGTDTSF